MAQDDSCADCHDDNDNDDDGDKDSKSVQFKHSTAVALREVSVNSTDHTQTAHTADHSTCEPDVTIPCTQTTADFT